MTTTRPAATPAAFQAAMQHLDELHREVTGQRLPRGKEPYAPLPEDLDPWLCVHQSLRHLSTLLARYAAQPQPQPPWIPPADLYETEDSWDVELWVPDLDETSLRVSCRNGILAAEGRRRCESSSSRSARRLETPPGSFARWLTLPQGADPDAVRAEYGDGVVRIRIGKSEGGAPEDSAAASS